MPDLTTQAEVTELLDKMQKRILAQKEPITDSPDAAAWRAGTMTSKVLYSNLIIAGYTHDEILQFTIDEPVT